MNNELIQEITDLQQEIKILRDELANYRWRDKKALIVKGLGSGFYIGSYDREAKIKAYEEQKWVTLMKVFYITKEVDTLMLQGYTFDEIVRAIKEYIAEQLAEDEENE